MAEKHVANAAKLFDAVVIATIVDLADGLAAGTVKQDVARFPHQQISIADGVGKARERMLHRCLLRRPGAACFGCATWNAD
jgi:hypothetical protein